MENFYNATTNFSKLQSNLYYKLTLAYLSRSPVNIFVHKGAFNRCTRILISLYGVIIIQPLIDAIIYNYLLSANRLLGVFCIELNEDLQVQRVHDMPYLNRRVYSGSIIIQSRDKLGMNVWGMFKDYLPDVSICMQQDILPVGNVVEVGFQTQPIEYVNISPNEVYALKNVLHIKQAKNLSTIQMEYVLLRCLIKLLTFGVVNGCSFSVAALESDIGAVELEATMGYYKQDNIGLLYNAMLESYTYKQDGGRVLQIMSERLNVPQFLLKDLI